MSPVKKNLADCQCERYTHLLIPLNLFYRDSQNLIGMGGSVPIEFKCQSCHKTLRVPDEFAGRKAKCPNCQTILQVAAKSETVKPLDVQPPIESSSNPFARSDSSIPNRSSTAAGNPYSSPQSQPQPLGRRHFRGAPHRGGLVLGLGIGAMTCNFCLIPGILALIFGLADLKAMKEGRMDDEGQGLTLAGTIMGGIMTAIGALIVLFYAVVVIAALAGGL